MSGGGKFDSEWLSGSHGIEVEGGLFNIVVPVGGSMEEEETDVARRGFQFYACRRCG